MGLNVVAIKAFEDHSKMGQKQYESQNRKLAYVQYYINNQILIKDKICGLDVQVLAEFYVAIFIVWIYREPHAYITHFILLQCFVVSFDQGTLVCIDSFKQQ